MEENTIIERLRDPKSVAAIILTVALIYFGSRVLSRNSEAESGTPSNAKTAAQEQPTDRYTIQSASWRESSVPPSAQPESAPTRPAVDLAASAMAERWQGMTLGVSGGGDK